MGCMCRLTVSLCSPRPIPEPPADAVPALAHWHPLLPQQHLPHPAEAPQVARGPAALRDPQRHPGHHPRPLQPGLPHPGRQQPAGSALDWVGQRQGEGKGQAAGAGLPRGSGQPPPASPLGAAGQPELLVAGRGEPLLHQLAGEGAPADHWLHLHGCGWELAHGWL